MNIHEYGMENKKIVMLVHPSIVMWDYFEYVIPLMEQEYHLAIPALPGYDPETKDDFTSVEKIASELSIWCKEKEIEEIECLYGCSMGGSIVLRKFATRVSFRKITGVGHGGLAPLHPEKLVRGLKRCMNNSDTAERGAVKLICGKRDNISGDYILCRNYIDAAFSGGLYPKLRVLVWKQWKVRKARMRGLIKCGINPWQATLVAGIGDKYMKVSNLAPVKKALPKAIFVKAGLVCPYDYYIERHALKLS